MKNLFKRFVREEEGQDLIEYALVAAIITLATVAIIGNVGTAVTAIWNKIDTTVSSAAQ